MYDLKRFDNKTPYSVQLIVKFLVELNCFFKIMYNFDKIKILKLNFKKYIFYIKNEKYLVKIKIIFFIIVL